MSRLVAFMLPLAVALGLICFSSAACAGVITRRCIAKSKGQGCPVVNTASNDCGYISICTSQGKPQPGYAKVCDNCGPLPAGGSAAKKCDYGSGKCVINNGEGGPCRPKGVPGGPTRLCTAPGTTCRAVKGQSGKYRCCRTSCPPGLCGAFNNGPTYWKNQCEEEFLCPGTCPK